MSESDKSAGAGGIATAKNGEIAFLRRLARWSGVASPQDLGPVTDRKENGRRQKCKRHGFATYDDGYWRLTEKGRAFLRGEISKDPTP